MNKPKSSKNKAKTVETKSVKLKLSTKDRVVLNGLFPERNDILGQMVARDIANKTSLCQAEVEKIGLKKRNEGGFEWKIEKAKDKIIEFTSAEMQFLNAQVTRLDNAKQITSDLLELCLKITEIGG